ncbi:HlyD family secretion protein [Anaerobranca gottschalkii]|uniref:Multidrug resistance efflux pump n=1 Tax=Anaerobranca gottschalkii DSM 13577 TaxID=1120990 RepID=A0A1I0B8Q3_9FIRM|nr:HlyD family efflux transporter periplasmic adaptor subunit [Anaerobranca gottschalkii]SET03140.1 Multidrug resistance efflux pump [Anaerobranca gottschalkii DSM 13577]
MRLYKKEELRTSRIFFDKQPPKFLKIFIIFISFILITAIYSSTKINKPYIVKAQGVVTTTDNQYISAKTSGVIQTINKTSGEKVKRGEVLFTITTGLEGIQKEAILEQIDNLKKQLEVLDRYKKSLVEKKNLLKKEGIELEYYGKVQYYLDSISKEKAEKERLNKELEEKRREYEKLSKGKEELKEKLDNFTSKENLNEEKLEIESNLETKKTQLEAKREEIQQIQIQLDNLNNYSQSKQIYYQLISELGQVQNTIEGKLIELKGNLELAKGQDKIFEIKANDDGIVHYLIPIKKGMSIQQNQMIAEISSSDRENLIVEAYINAQDRTKINIGNQVDIAVSGVNIYKYGTLKGKLVHIDIGTITQETSGGNLILYRSLIAIDDNKLTSRDNSTVEILKSMPVEARIVYEKETYFQWIMKLLNFRN